MNKDEMVAGQVSLVERLRDLGIRSADQAADEIERLSARIKEQDEVVPKLEALERLCRNSGQPFFADLIDEVLTALLQKQQEEGDGA